MGQQGGVLADTSGSGPKYYRIPVALYKDGDIIPDDVYFLYQGNYVIFRSKNSAWRAEDSRKLIDFGTKELYIKCDSEKDHLKFLEKNLGKILKEERTSKTEKAGILYECATNIAHDLFEKPSSPQTLIRTKQVVDHTIDLLAKDSDAFIQMISLSSHDIYTYTHCVNVMTFTVALLAALGIKDAKTLEDAAIGAFLHDIGKAKVPLEILNKAGPLVQEEWAIMKQHPTWGLEVLGSQPVPERGKKIIVEHHEKVNGIGYPYGLKGDRIQLVSQVVSICDAYDAMTSNRCYQKAKAPFVAFQIISQEMRGHFNPNIVETFIRLLNFEKKS